MTSLKRTAVCCLSSLNLEKYDEWKDTNIVADLIRFLDNVLEYFIRLAPSELKRAVHSARKERSLGLGTLGWHSYLQSKLIPFDSTGFDSAEMHTEIIYSDIQQKAIEESRRLAKLRGEPSDCAGSGMRNAHLMAVAPNASSSSIVNTSPSIEPWNSNAFNAQGRAGSFLIKNKYLERELEKIGMNTPEVWKQIVLNEGSVYGIDGLPDYIRDVFKTASEIDPIAIINLAAIRQKYICQSQSLNIFVHNDISLGEMSDLHIAAWIKGVKTMYYCRSKPASRAKLGDGTTKPLNAVDVSALRQDDNTCVACEG